MVTSLVTFLSSPVANELRFLFSFYLKLNMGSSNWSWHLDEDFAVYNIARFVERELSLKLDLALREDTPWIRKIIIHKININTIMSENPQQEPRELGLRYLQSFCNMRVTMAYLT